MSWWKWLLTFLRHLRRFFEADHLRIEVTAGHPWFVAKGDKFMADIQEGSSIRVRVSARKPDETPAALDGFPQITSSDTAVITVTTDPANPFEATVQGVKAGTAKVEASGDADLGPGQRVIQGFLDVVVTAVEADHLVVEVV